MGKHISQRLQYGKQLYIWGWRWVAFVVWGIPYGLANLYAFLRGEGYLQNFPNLSSWLPSWSYNVWVIVGILAFVVITFEGSYRISHKQSQATKSDFSLVWYEHEWWLRTTNGKRNYWDDEINAIGLLLVGSLSINTLKQIQVENVELDIGGHMFKSDWKSQRFYISEERGVNFNIPLSEPRGKRTVKLQAIVDGIPWQSEPFTIELPQGKQVFHKESPQN